MPSLAEVRRETDPGATVAVEGVSAHAVRTTIKDKIIAR
jgi:hypothetical protein